MMLHVMAQHVMCFGAAEGFSQMAAGSMMAARQAANAQLELFRAEMAAESAKIRAVVERQVGRSAERLS